MATIAKFQPMPFKSMFNDFFFNPVFDGGHAATLPAVNVVEKDNGFRLEVAAPGFDKSDFNIKVEKDLLTVSAQKTANNEENTPNYRRREFLVNQFERSFRLPETIDQDQVKAVYENGILHIDLLKKPELVPAVRTIEVA